MLPLAASERGHGHRLIRDGDLVIVYENHKCMKAVTVSKNGEFQNRYGLFQHDDWIGKPFGCRVESKKGKFVHLLAPTPQLWTLVLTHRTQILYIADISFVLAYLEVRPGCVVLESGTGSGSLTTALARAVAPTGHVYSFDFHEQRADAARKDFERNGLKALITVHVRDIQGEGFPADFAGEVDAVFLDLPQPWTAIPSVINLLKADAPLCTFSPCVEQVHKTCAALTRLEFRDLRTFEVLLRTFEVHEESFGTSFGSGGIVDRSKNSPARKRRYSGVEKDGDGDGDGLLKKCKLLAEDRSEVSQESRPDDISVSLAPKNFKGVGQLQLPLSDPVGRKLNLVKKYPKNVRNREELTECRSMIVARPEAEMKGHTGYLTFARRTV